jgi:hypothetical protein
MKFREDQETFPSETWEREGGRHYEYSVQAHAFDHNAQFIDILKRSTLGERQASNGSLAKRKKCSSLRIAPAIFGPS